MLRIYNCLEAVTKNLIASHFTEYNIIRAARKTNIHVRGTIVLNVHASVIQNSLYKIKCLGECRRQNSLHIIVACK